MTRKMLRTPQHICGLHSLNKSDSFKSHIFFILPKRTVPDNWIRRIRVNINIGSKIELHAQFFTMFTYTKTSSFNEFIILHCPHCHIPKISKS